MACSVQVALMLTALLYTVPTVGTRRSAIGGIADAYAPVALLMVTDCVEL